MPDHARIKTSGRLGRLLQSSVLATASPCQCRHWQYDTIAAKIFCKQDADANDDTVSERDETLQSTKRDSPFEWQKKKTGPRASRRKRQESENAPKTNAVEIQNERGQEPPVSSAVSRPTDAMLNFSDRWKIDNDGKPQRPAACWEEKEGSLKAPLRLEKAIATCWKRRKNRGIAKYRQQNEEPRRHVRVAHIH